MVGTNNSGGSEIVFVRGSATLAPLNPNPSPQEQFRTVALPKVTRKAIREKRWIRHYVDYNPNWIPSETQHVLGCYEQDQNVEDDKYITGTALVTVTIPQVGTIERGLELEFSFKSVNQAQYNNDLYRCTYFEKLDVPSPSDRGGLRDGWRIFQGQHVDFTLPYIK